MKDSHIQFYALLLLSDMKWEVAYSTLCTDIFFFLEICTSIYTWQAYISFLSQACSDTTRTQTRKHSSTRQSDLRGVHDSSNI